MSALQRRAHEMLALFRAAADGDRMFTFHAMAVAEKMAITRQAALNLMSVLIGAGCVERVGYTKPSGERAWKYKLTGADLVDPPVTAARARLPLPQHMRKISTGRLPGDPPPGRSALDQKRQGEPV